MLKKSTKAAVKAEPKKTTTKKAAAAKPKVGFKDIVVTELSAWGIPKGTFTYDAVLTLTKVAKHGMTYKEAVAAVAKKLGKPALTVEAAYSRLANTAEFKNSCCPKLAKTKEPTKQQAIETLLNFC